jgi:hypothetical protein
MKTVSYECDRMMIFNLRSKAVRLLKMNRLEHFQDSFKAKQLLTENDN